MSKNNQKSDNFLKIALIISTVGISSILIVFMFIFCKDRFTSYDDYKYNYSLRPGYYEVGVDIPAGTYVIELVEGEEAEFSIYKDQGSSISFQKKYYVYDNKKGEKDIIKLPYGGVGISGVRKVSLKKRISNITLKEGQVLKIEPQTSFIFYANDIENTSFDPIEVAYSDITVGSNVFFAAKDFPAGVYDIIYEPKDSNQVGTVKCEIKNIDASFSIQNGYFFDCEGKNGTQMIAHGMPFTPGSSISVGNLTEITLVPTKYIGETFNSLTWEAGSN